MRFDDFMLCEALVPMHHRASKCEQQQVRSKNKTASKGSLALWAAAAHLPTSARKAVGATGVQATEATG